MFAFLRKLRLHISFAFHAHIPTVHSFPVHPLSHKHEYSLSPSIHFPCCPQKIGATWSSTTNMLFLGSQSSISRTREKCLNFYFWLSRFTLLFNCYFIHSPVDFSAVSIVVPGSLYYLSFWTNLTVLHLHLHLHWQISIYFQLLYSTVSFN